MRCLQGTPDPHERASVGQSSLQCHGWRERGWPLGPWCHLPLLFLDRPNSNGPPRPIPLLPNRPLPLPDEDVPLRIPSRPLRVAVSLVRGRWDRSQKNVRTRRDEFVEASGTQTTCFVPRGKAQKGWLPKDGTGTKGNVLDAWKEQQTHRPDGRNETWRKR